MKRQSLARSIGFAINGILFFFRKERNAGIHLVAATVVVLLGLFFKLSGWEWVSIVFSILSVWVTEMINTAIESLCDHLHPGKSEQIGKVKDISAGAVLVSAIASLVIGAIVFIPKILT